MFVPSRWARISMAAFVFILWGVLRIVLFRIHLTVVGIARSSIFACSVAHRRRPKDTKNSNADRRRRRAYRGERNPYWHRSCADDRDCRQLRWWRRWWRRWSRRLHYDFLYLLISLTRRIRPIKRIIVNVCIELPKCSAGTPDKLYGGSLDFEAMLLHPIEVIKK
jgi:hypothetical protein